MTSPLPAETEEYVRRIIGCALRVHSALGPGFGEHIYLEALCLELDAGGLPFEREKAISVGYRDLQIGVHRADLIVAGQVIVELKAVERLDRAHVAQVLAYLKATRLRVGLLINFNVPLLRAGLRRVVL